MNKTKNAAGTIKKVVGIILAIFFALMIITGITYPSRHGVGFSVADIVVIIIFIVLEVYTVKFIFLKIKQ